MFGVPLLFSKSIGIRPQPALQLQAPVPVGIKPRVRPGRRLVGIFGGSFDPPTRAHLTRIRELATTYRQAVIDVDGKPAKRRLDALWVVPSRPDMLDGYVKRETRQTALA